MDSKDEIFNAILRITGGDDTKEFTKTAVTRELGLSKPSSKIDKALKELEEEGVIKVKAKRGNATYYVLVKKSLNQKTESSLSVQQPAIQLPAQQNEIKQALREVLEEFFGKPKSFEDLDKTYEFMKDSLGYVSIENLRKQLGLSIEQFMAKFGDYVLSNYELIPGGKDGFIKGGVLYGIIRRKDHVRV
ncbi:hypothetical protein [Acidianus sp. HS-5]|uniref:hypothetical protein n=1 Tax=Acidianus sp. HS-5 TaxID=2886040 RepID=UPI001F3707FE|nr:hypothetical protein [Acidianus sp. HS-5]